MGCLPSPRASLWVGTVDIATSPITRTAKVCEGLINQDGYSTTGKPAVERIAEPGLSADGRREFDLYEMEDSMLLRSRSEKRAEFPRAYGSRPVLEKILC